MVFTDNDLDGAGSALLLKKLFTGHEVIIVDTTEWNILNEFKSRWNTLDHFDKIFVCDLSLSEEQAELCDAGNVGCKNCPFEEKPMKKMKETCIMLDELHQQYLQERWQQKGVKKSRTVRDALDKYMKSNPNKRQK